MGRRCAFEFRNDDSLNTMCKKKEKKVVFVKQLSPENQKESKR